MDNLNLKEESGFLQSSNETDKEMDNNEIRPESPNSPAVIPETSATSDATANKAFFKNNTFTVPAPIATSFPYFPFPTPAGFPFNANLAMAAAASAFPLSANAVAAATMYNETTTTNHRIATILQESYRHQTPQQMNRINCEDLFPPTAKMRKIASNNTDNTFVHRNTGDNLERTPVFGHRGGYFLPTNLNPNLTHSKHACQESQCSRERMRLQQEVMTLKTKMLQMSHNLGVIIAEQVLTSEAAERISSVLSSADMSFLADDLIVELEKKVSTCKHHEV